jgi:inner membrane protein
MDPLSQGLVGAAAAQILLSKRVGKRAWLYGALGGMAPDLDVLIRSSADPLLHLEYHRHFTHALPFAPFGGALASLPFLPKRNSGQWRLRPDWLLVMMTFIVGYGTHGLLDLCTSYGTVMFWPFSSERFAIDWISIVDPSFTLPLGIGVFLTARRASLRPIVFASAFSLLYLLLGAWQHHRALDAQTQLAQHRGVQLLDQRVMPTIANLRTWRGVYRYSNGAGAPERLQADAIHVSFFGPVRIIEGSQVDLYRPESSNPKSEDPQLRVKLEKFRFFADDYLARSPEQPSLIGDMRYSFQPESFDPIWGVTIDSSQSPPAILFEQLGRKRDPKKLMRNMWAAPTGVKLADILSASVKAMESPAH